MPGFCPGERNSQPMPRPRKYSDEFRERTVRLVFESGWPVAPVARDLGVNHESLRSWVRQAQADAGQRKDLLTTSERERLKALERENREWAQGSSLQQSVSRVTRQVTSTLETTRLARHRRAPSRPSTERETFSARLAAASKDPTIAAWPWQPAEMTWSMSTTVECRTRCLGTNSPDRMSASRPTQIPPRRVCRLRSR